MDEESKDGWASNGHHDKNGGGGAVVQNGHHVLLSSTTGDEPHHTCGHACEEDDGRDYACGVWSIYPECLQKFANKKAFLAVFCLTSVLQGMYYTYFVSVLTTLEKLYKFQSKTTGIIMSATEIGQIGGALLLTYYGGQGHRPRWIACGMLVFAVASILCSTPHFIFGKETSVQAHEPNWTLSEHRTKLCHLPERLDWTRNNGSMSSCDLTEESPAKQDRITQVVLAVFFISLLFIGIGATAVYTLGIPYIDDNVATRESPLYFGITIGVRIFGPVFGFLLGAFCTGVYVNFPFESPAMATNDPSFIGAWWLGVFIVGAALILTSLPMMAFPKKLRQQARDSRQQVALPSNGGVCPLRKSPAKKQSKKPSLKDFPAAMRRLLRNEILLYRTASSVLHILPIAGLYTFFPKFLENQFQMTSSRADMIAGLAGILVMGVGIFASGMYMRKVKPNAKFVARWIAFTALAYAIGMVLLMWIGCPLNNFARFTPTDGDNREPVLSTSLHCNTTECSCPNSRFSPICTGEGTTYLSPCAAGCTRVDLSPEEQYVFSECHCLEGNLTAVSGYCPLECNNLVWYILVFSFFVLIHSTSEVGSMLLTLRCVDPQDKAMALGLISFAIGLFGNVPCPIIYGAVVDSACLFWEDNCGQQGACRVYDPVRFRMVFHGLTAVIMLLAFVVDVVIWYKSGTIQFHDEDEVAATPAETQPMNVPLSISPPPLVSDSHLDSCV